ncbi:MAG: selenium cofactor biosynthesis protein YqeC [Chloroflexota bacterium]
MRKNPEPPPFPDLNHLEDQGSGWSLPQAFSLQPSGEIVAIVGGGGKTSLMFSLAKTLPGNVVTTTTTRIFSTQMKLAPAVCYAGEQGGGTGRKGVELVPLTELGSLLTVHGHCLVVGRVEGEKASGVSPTLPAQLLARPEVDIVLVEADGSRMKPCKAPAAHEPVIPTGTRLLIPVAGVDAMGQPLVEVAHRPELVSKITGLGMEDVLTEEALATLITHPAGGKKGLPATARMIPLINKVESAERLAAARQVAGRILQDDRVDQVVVGAMNAPQPVVEVHRRVAAVVLAAGESERMGRTKLLLPWGQTTVLGQTLANLKASAANEILVVSGHEASTVETIAAEAKVPTIHNPNYAAGEMLSSLQVAVQNLPGNRAAVLVVLADQPLVKPETIDQILISYWQGGSEIIAPAYQGQRGNPVLIGRPFFDELLGLPVGSAPRDLLKRHPAAVRLIHVPTQSILVDLDTPAHYDRWRPKE